jgi:hypothetical protein
MDRAVVARLVTIGGLALVVLGLTVIPWGAAGVEASPSEVRALYTEFPSADFNESVQRAYHLWGFWLFIGLCLVAAFLVDGPVAAAVAVAIGVAACGAWHQAGIGTVTNLGFGAYAPEIGAALVVVGLLIGIAEVREPSS